MRLQLLDDEALEIWVLLDLRPLEAAHALSESRLGMGILGVVLTTGAVFFDLIRDRIGAPAHFSRDRSERVSLPKQDTDLQAFRS